MLSSNHALYGTTRFHYEIAQLSAVILQPIIKLQTFYVSTLELFKTGWVEDALCYLKFQPGQTGEQSANRPLYCLILFQKNKKYKTTKKPQDLMPLLEYINVMLSMISRKIYLQVLVYLRSLAYWLLHLSKIFGN